MSNTTVNRTALSSLLALALSLPVVAAEPDRTKQPPPGGDVTWQPPSPQRAGILGMDAFIVERHDVPIVELGISWNVGEVLDPAGKEGMHGLCTDLLDESTKSLAKSALEDRKADLGASISIGAGRESAGLSLRVAKERLPGALDLVAQILLEPGLAQADLERLRAQYKASVMQSRASADSVAARVASPVLWGAAHPYGHVVTEASLDAITAADCAKVASLYKPTSAQLVAVGDVTATELEELFRTRLAAWQGKAPGRARIGPPKTAKGTLFFVDVPGAAQSSIRVAHMGPSRNAPDYYASTVMTQVLGQGLSSRIVQNLRERNGYTYGARAGFGYARSGSTFGVSSSVRTDATGPALREVLAEMKGMTTRPPTDDEVNRERLGTIRALPSRFGTAASTLGSIQELLFFDLPLDTWAKMPAAVNAVTTADVVKAVAERLRTQDLVVIVAGDGAKVLPELRKLVDEKAFGAAGLVLLDGDGTPKK